MKLAIPTLSVSRSAGGLFFSVRRLTQELARDGRLRCCVLGPRDRYTERDLKQWSPLHPETYAVRGPAALGYSPELDRQLDRFRPDVIHSHGIWTYHSLASSRWAGRARIPHIVSPRGMLDPWALGHKSWKKRLAGCLYQNRSLRSAACLHALNRSEYEAIRGYGLRNPVCIIPNGVDIPPGPTGPRRDGRRVLLYLGRLHPKKGLPTLLKAWAKVKPSLRQDWELVIAGWNQAGHRQRLAQIISDCGIGDSVRLTGPRFGAAKDACFREAAAVILPSLSEGLPMVLLEAWSYALPVIMTPQCNLPEGFDACAGERIEPHEESIRAGLERFFQRSDRERWEMGKNGLALVKQRYSWRRVADRMQSVYAWATGDGAAPSCVVMD